jgi:hypothetical protein
MANVYTLGQQVRLTATFKSSAGTATDPTGVVLKYRAPGGPVTTKTYGVDAIVKSGTGVYYFDLVLSTAGEWWYHWAGSGAVVAVDEERILVEGTRMV